MSSYVSNDRQAMDWVRDKAQKLPERKGLDPARCVDVKAVTWHEGRVEHDGERWRGRIVLDV